MNIKIDIEMTPEELRRFFGLPDVSELQETFMSTMKQTMLDRMREQGVPDAQAGLLEQSFKAMEAYQKMFMDALQKSGDRTPREEAGD